MNTGVQDAYNLAWKLALAAEGSAAPQLLPSYDAERRPVGEEVVGRTVRHAVEGIEADPDAPTTLMLREAQLLVGYRGSPLVGEPDPDSADGPQPGDRAPDCGGLTREIATYAVRLYDLLRETDHVLLWYGSPRDGAFDELAATVGGSYRGRVVPRVILPEGEPDRGTGPPAYWDGRGEFARLYGVRGPTVFVVRPDGYLGARICPPTVEALGTHLAGVLRLPEPSPL